MRGTPGNTVADVVGRRMSRAFPELALSFAWLSERYRTGAALRPLMQVYPSHIGEERTARLRDELADAQNFGLSDERKLDVLLTPVLGLDEMILVNEHETPESLLAHFEHTLSTITP